jgi:hypothetical protein
MVFQLVFSILCKIEALYCIKSSKNSNLPATVNLSYVFTVKNELDLISYSSG